MNHYSIHQQVLVPPSVISDRSHTRVMFGTLYWGALGFHHPRTPLLSPVCSLFLTSKVPVAPALNQSLVCWSTAAAAVVVFVEYLVQSHQLPSCFRSLHSTLVWWLAAVPNSSLPLPAKPVSLFSASYTWRCLTTTERALASFLFWDEQQTAYNYLQKHCTSVRRTMLKCNEGF